MGKNEEYQRMVEELTGKLEEGVANILNGDNFRDWLNMQAKFHDYSFQNTMLILLQNPDASMVAGFQKWKHDFGRSVKAGEKGMRIFAPHEYTRLVQRAVFDENGHPVMEEDGTPRRETVRVRQMGFHPVSVFDVSQTEGKELPSMEVPLLQGEVDNYSQIKEALLAISPVPVSYEKEMPGEAKGFFSSAEQRIAVRAGMPQMQEVKTTAHEVAHSLAHDTSNKRIDGLDENFSRRVKEIEAESAAYVFCQHFGIDTSDYSLSYIAAWGSEPDTKLLKASMENIAKISKEMINKAEDFLLSKTQEQSVEQSREVSQQSVEPNNEREPEKGRRKGVLELDMGR